MQISETQLINDLKAGHYAPVYLLTGDENYYIDLISDYFENNIVEESLRGFDQVVLYGNEVTMDDVIANAKQFPMMSPYKLVLVKEAQSISKDAQSIANASESEGWEKVAAYLENPLPQTILVFCYRYKKFDKRTKAFKAIDAKGCICEKNRMYDSQLPDWIGTYVNRHDHAITQKGAILIAESIGNDLSKITNELDKVFIAIGPGEDITEETIERYIGISKEYNIFELQDAIGRRNVVKCNRIVNHFASNPKSMAMPLILATLYGFFIKVMIYHQLEDKTKAASVLKINAYFVKDYAAAANNYSLGKLASCIGYLHNTDLRSKGIRNAGTVTDGELLKELVFKIIH